MGLGDNLGGLGENIENLKNEHGDQINQGIDGAQDKFGDKLPVDSEQIDGAQDQFLGGGEKKEEGQ